MEFCPEAPALGRPLYPTVDHRLLAASSSGSARANYDDGNLATVFLRIS